MCFYMSARLGKFTMCMLQSYNPNTHISTQNLSYEQDCNNLKVTVLHLPRTKTAGDEGEDIFWASHNGNTDPTAALQNHLQINQPAEMAHLFAYQAKKTHKPSPRQNSLRGWGRQHKQPVGTAAGPRDSNQFHPGVPAPGHALRRNESQRPLDR